MATEVSFARTFLAILDTKPQKITADHVEDPRNYPAATPVLHPPPPPRPMSKPHRRGSSSPSAPSSTSPSTSEQHTVAVSVRSLRNPPLDISLPAPLPVATTSALDVKAAVAAQTGIPLDKIKLLYNKKPAADSKTLKDLLAQPAGGEVDSSVKSIEFSVMVMGGAATLAAAEAARRQAKEVEEEDKKAATTTTTPMEVDSQGREEEEDHTVAQGLSGAPVLETEQFWADLEGFLQQRVRDEKTAGELVKKFRGAWTAGK
ncbi:cell-cycle control medial ring component [Bombardia bombarda]|uniref:Cell-cycle control medial ring component n=1 Tax=Bombardia bombarda TaxID=252184 RepID=A0AA40CD85_9PEZI|nr:cell-cycle control medial ring component [Bombardia bombarda]